MSDRPTPDRPKLSVLPGGAGNGARDVLAAAPRHHRPRRLDPSAHGGKLSAASSASGRGGPVGLAALGPRPRGPLGTALAAASAWLIEPAEPSQAPELALPTPSRRVIAVFGLARACGATVVSRALAAELARRDVAGAAAVHCDARATGIPLATQAASELARALADVPGADTRAVGRLCLVGGTERAALAETARYFAPLVIDAGSAAVGGAPAALADRVVVVTAPAVEPALASVAAACLGRLGHRPIVVVNRAGRRAPAAERLDALTLPDSRMGAQLALGGREARGDLGRAIGELADLCER